MIKYVIKCDKVKKKETERVKVELCYLRSPPALSAGPHMENQVSGPLGTDVCSPLDSSQSATEAVLCRNLAHSRHPTATSHSHLEQREKNFAHRVKHKQANGKEKHSVAGVDMTSVLQTHNQRKA